jgi:uncharacterized membrane protein
MSRASEAGTRKQFRTQKMMPEMMTREVDSIHCSPCVVEVLYLVGLVTMLVLVAVIVGISGVGWCC